MSERISPETRSRMMSSIRGTNTKPERLVRSGLHAQGFRFRLHVGSLPGRPDLVMPKWRVALFVHGCFWHGHLGCRYFKIPKIRTNFWVDKIAGNTRRDLEAIKRLRADGWRVGIVWECALRQDARRAVIALNQFIRSDDAQVEIAEKL